LGDLYQDQGLVFANQTCGTMRQYTPIGGSFTRLLQQAELPDIRFHDLRYTCATLLLSLMSESFNFFIDCQALQPDALMARTPFV
jgi:hypothetical protein